MARTHFRGTSQKRRTLPSLWARTTSYSLCYDECMFRTSHALYIFLRASSISLKKSETENWKKRGKKLRYRECSEGQESKTVKAQQKEEH